jgi:hypothetical protein
VGRDIPRLDGAAIVSLDLIGVFTSGLLTAFELHLGGEVVAVDGTVVKLEEGSEVIRYKAHLST